MAFHVIMERVCRVNRIMAYNAIIYDIRKLVQARTHFSRVYGNPTPPVPRPHYRGIIPRAPRSFVAVFIKYRSLAVYPPKQFDEA